MAPTQPHKPSDKRWCQRDSLRGERHVPSGAQPVTLAGSTVRFKSGFISTVTWRSTNRPSTTTDQSWSEGGRYGRTYQKLGKFPNIANRVKSNPLALQLLFSKCNRLQRPITAPVFVQLL